MLFEILKRKVHTWGLERNIYTEGTLQAQISKIIEEANEVEIAFKDGDIDELEKELGDVLVTVINTCKMLNIPPETCLYRAYEKIKDRKGKMLNGTFVKEL